MTEVSDDVRSIRRITDIDVDEFRGIAARADEFKVTRSVRDLGIMTPAPDAPLAYDN
jgi:hypothetical protein